MLKRRSLLSALGGIGACYRLDQSRSQLTGLFSLALAQQAQGAGLPSRKVVYIHLGGGWNGWSMGLLQPSKPGVEYYPKGIFQPDVQGGSTNPFVNRHFASGKFVFNAYSKILDSVSDHLILATINARTNTHEIGKLFQSSGGDGNSNLGYPTWPAGVGSVQAMLNPKKMIRVINAAGPLQLGRTGQHTTFMPASTMLQLANNFLDSAEVSSAKKGVREKHVRILRDLATQVDGPAPILVQDAEKMKTILDGLTQGVPSQIARDPDNPNSNTASIPVKNLTMASLISELSIAKLTELVKSSMTVDGVDIGGASTLARLDVPANTSAIEAFLERLRVAALSARSDTAQGISIGAPFGGDHHFGGADVVAAEQGALTLGCVSLFWNWIISQGLQNDVLVVLSSDFSRSPYNNSYFDITVSGQPTPIRAYGCDHWPVGYMLLLNGNLAAGRVGGLLDAATTAGSIDLEGALDPDMPGYTSSQVMGSALLRIWPEMWNNRPVSNGWRAIKEIWPNFSEKDVLPIIMG